MARQFLANFAPAHATIFHGKNIGYVNFGGRAEAVGLVNLTKAKAEAEPAHDFFVVYLIVGCQPAADRVGIGVGAGNGQSRRDW